MTEARSALPTRRQAGTRAAIAVPMLRDGIAIGALHLRRLAAQRFDEQQVTLLESFANQAVITSNPAIVRWLDDK